MNRMNNSIFASKNTVMTGILVVISLICMGTSSAAIFNVYTVVCAPSWYCTAYDHGDCGTRTCIDVNGCGSNVNKPIEYLVCEEQPSGKGDGGGSGYISPEPVIGTLPEGYFTLNMDMIKVTIEQGIVVQKIISINSSKPEEYHLEIQYPSSYTRGTDFVSTTSDAKEIDTVGDFNIIIDSREILIGTYVIPIKVYNKDYSKTIGLTIDVIPINNPEIEISLDSKIKNLGIDTEILTFTKTKGLQADYNTTFTYIILDPKGNVITTEDLSVEDASRVEHKVTLPVSLGEGYYILSVRIDQKNETYVKSEQFTILTPNKYVPVIENPRRGMTLWIWVIIIIASAITLFNTGLFYKSYTPAKRRINRRIGNWNASGRPKSSIAEKFRMMIEQAKEKKTLDIEHKMEVLKKSYEGGFISAKEYHDIAKRYGYSTEIGSVEDRKLSDKENVEAIMKRQSEDNAKREYQKIQEQHKDSATDLREEKSIPISLSNAINIPIDKGRDKNSQEVKMKIEHLESVHPQTESLIEEKKNILDAPEAEKPVSGNSIGGAIAHMFAQSIIDKKVHYDQAFVLNNHERLYSIRDLMDALPNMPEHFFEHHTQHGRNDFSNWIGDVFQYYDIAEDIRNVKSREELAEMLKKYA